MQRFISEIVSSGLLIDELIHGLVALPFAIYLWEKSHQARLVVVLYLVTYLIDLDHLFDYFLFYGLRLDLFEFVDMRYFEISQKAFVPFHAWEWVFLFALVSIRRGWKSLATALVFGMIPHLVLDTFVQTNLWFYSITYRVLIGKYGF